MLRLKVGKCSEKDGDTTQGHRAPPRGAVKLRGKNWADGGEGAFQKLLRRGTDHM